MRVLVVHNRYRYVGGEERAVELQLAALERAGMPSAALVRDSASLSGPHAARAMLRGGERPDEVGRAVRELGANVVHFHNLHPMFGHRGIEAARRAGARTVLHLHNYRLFCAIGVAFRDGGDCFRCRGRRTVPGLVLNCRGSVAQSVVYTTALSLHQPDVLAAVDAFVTPSHYAAARHVRLGVPRERLSVVANYIPDHEMAERSRAAEGTYALLAGRLSAEKGVAEAIDAARASGVPLTIAGTGPLERELRERAHGAAGVEFLGRVDRAEVRRLLDGAAMALVPSISGDVMPFAALEAMAAGVPVAATDAGSLPEVLGPERTVPRQDVQALAGRMRALFADPEARRRDGDAGLERVRRLFGETRYVDELRAVYEGAQNTRTPDTLESMPCATP